MTISMAENGHMAFPYGHMAEHIMGHGPWARRHDSSTDPLTRHHPDARRCHTLEADRINEARRIRAAQAGGGCGGAGFGGMLICQNRCWSKPATPGVHGKGRVLDG